MTESTDTEAVLRVWAQWPHELKPNPPPHPKTAAQWSGICVLNEFAANSVDASMNALDRCNFERVRPVSLVRLTFLAAICFVSIVQPATAQKLNLQPLYDTPVYFAPAKKYFALINKQWAGLNWDHAYQDAEARVFKGIHGRLAIVDSLEVHEFLLMTFHSEWESWIGLRYWCDRHKLQWSDDRFLELGSFEAWDKAWMQEDKLCNGASMPNHPEQYMPVAYNPISKGDFRWIAKGWYKKYDSYFIEFPTGGP